MLENYLDIITNMENYVDGVIVTDTKANIVYIRRYTNLYFQKIFNFSNNLQTL